ncbi:MULTISPECIES: hypothetical protein [unclassified Coleofasciculus]|uniref:hypothetical protein n=1 Tax=unclassified Coleofasciculus TaxID=2692782 RepID=UPI00187E14D6|nr:MULTISPECIES: hypothetical protein [unclassified Coleofasciculus]MBE9129983.1 hypothetical protein [Coleofasciculus sp. LEGE 07081]MBE9151208.1 hypothetical protein [Coleofasciculus sp. LEGE 07092]
MKRQKLTRLTKWALGVSVGAAVFLGWLGNLQSGIAIAAMVLASAISYQYPRTGLWAFLVYLPFGGSVTYAIGDGHPLFHLIKDAFYLPALIALIQSKPCFESFFQTTKPLIPALLGLLTLCLMALLFINLPQQLEAQPPDLPLLMGILGLKTLMGYIPLMLCAYFLIRNQRDLLFLNRLHVILILISCSLAFLQYLFLLNGLCPGSSGLAGTAVHQASLEARCLVGGSLLYNPQRELIRLPGTFVAPWQWGWFLISSSFLTYAAHICDSSRQWRWVSWIAIAFVFALTVISGQRIALALVPLILLILLLLTDHNKPLIPVKFGIATLLGIVSVNYLDKVHERLESLVGRWQASPPYKFVMEQFDWVIAQKEGWLGNGLGRATNAARILGDTQLIETYYATLLYEIGPLGVLAFLALISTLVVLTFKAYRSIQNSDLRRFGLCLWVFMILVGYNTYYYPLSVDPVAVYYWFFAGVLLKLPILESKERSLDVTNQNCN